MVLVHKSLGAADSGFFPCLYSLFPAPSNKQLTWWVERHKDSLPCYSTCIVLCVFLGNVPWAQLFLGVWVKLQLPISFKSQNHTSLKSNLAHLSSCLLYFQLDVGLDRFKSFHSSEIISGLVSQGMPGPCFSHATYSLLGEKLMPTGLWWPWASASCSPSSFHTLGPRLPGAWLFLWVRAAEWLNT